MSKRKAKWHILIVEDDANSQEVLSDILQYNDVGVDVVDNGHDALQRLRQTRDYTAAIIDLRLPGMSGWDLVDDIQRIASIPCIAITAYDNDRVSQEAAEAGFLAYFPKPVNERTFVAELRKLLH